MKKAFILTGLFSMFMTQIIFAADTAPKKFSASGQVITVDPVYSQVTIRHGAIKDFAGDTDTEFYAASGDLLKNIQKDDLVDFEFTDTKGDVKIDKITKTGVALPEVEKPLGTAVQEVLEGAGDVVKGVTSPITPAHEVAGGVMDATTGATSNVLTDASPEQKTKF